MAILKPFAGLRPSSELAAKVAAPPYDVLSSAEARIMAEGNPWSFLHINKPEIDLDPQVDVHDASVYQKGADNLARFISEGILKRDAAPCFYLYRQIMGAHVQTGLVALASVSEYEQNLIKKHEYTRPDKEEDRVQHMDYLNAQVGPVFLTYRHDQAINEFVSKASQAQPEYNFTSSDGNRHVFWVIDQPDRIAFLEKAFAAIPCLYVADGHHRSAAAQRIRTMRQQANSGHTGQEAYNFFLAVLFPHDQMQILDYNRVVRDLAGLDTSRFLKSLEKHFTVSVLDAPTKPETEHTFTMYLDGKWFLLATREAYIDESDPVARLDVSVLQNLLLAPVLGIGNPRTDERLEFVGGIRGLEELARLVDSGEFAAAFACYPTSIENLMAIADAGEVMPPKSTWFEPKLRSGLVIHSLD